jgi:prenyltransferase/squalene oxidase-like repeat protein
MGVPKDLATWLLDTKEPSVRIRCLTEVLGRSADDPEVVAATAEQGRSGWGHEILSRQLPDGQWDAPSTSSRDLYVPKYIATNWRLLVLSDLGFSRAQPGIARAAEVVLRTEAGPTGQLGGSESEVCYTGNAVRMMTRFGYGDDPRVRAALRWLLDTQKSDGGWHCWPSETGTLDCWEALAAFAAMPRSTWTDAVRRSVAAGAEFYLSRGLLHEGDAYEPWLRLHYPHHYYYDLLVGLEVLTALGYASDPRLAPALDLLEARRRPDGAWNLDAAHPDLPADEEYQVRTPYYPFVLETPGRPSRWITLNALAVLQRAGRG